MRYKFPTTWHINKTNLNELACVLHKDEKWLKQFEGKIPTQYHTVPITKKDGSVRSLSVPSDELKNFQRIVLVNLFKFQFPNHVQGGVHGRSIVTNASLHKEKKWVACLDISKFFPSIHYSQVKQIFLDLGCSEEIADTLTHFTSYEYELPQGAPTSPTIANLILYNLDVRIQKLCQIKRLTYSRYFDDITVSGNHSLDVACEKVIEIAHSEGFKIHKDNKEKFRKIPSWKTQVVTGIVVNRRQLEPNDLFIAGLERTIELVRNGKLPVVDFYKTLETAQGMLSFLNSVNSKKAISFKMKLQGVNWEKYGLKI